MKKEQTIHQVLSQLSNKKIAIDDVVTSYSSKKESHKSAWSYLLMSQLRSLGISADVLTIKDNVHDYDVWLVALPMELKGNSFNLFGGANDDTANRIHRLLEFKGKIFCLNAQMPDVGAFVLSRMGSSSDFWKSLDAAKISKICNETPTLNLVLDSETFVLGDSHSISVYVPGSNISRNDGKTLFGVLKEGIKNYLPEKTSHLITYFGNIDIRHHLCRQSDPIASAIDLANRYINQLAELNLRKISVVQALPIEHEGRRIPKTGYYKSTPFYGSWQERTNVCRNFNQTLSKLTKEHGFELIQWPQHWYEIKPEEYANLYMEKPGSVHLSRKYYQYDFETGKKNKLEQQIKINSLF